MNELNDAFLEDDIEMMQIKHPRMKRRIKCRAKKTQHKKWKAVVREQWRLRQVCRMEPMVEIDKPYPKGIDRYFKLSDKLKNHLHYSKICDALDYVNVVQYCRRGDFLQKSNKRWYKRKHEVDEISLTEICRLKIPEELLFCFVNHKGKPLSGYAEVWQLRVDQYSRKLKYRYSDFCEQVVVPHMITHKRVLLPEIEAELDRLDRYNERHQIWQKLARRNWRWFDYERKRKKFRWLDDQLVQEALLDHDFNQSGNQQTIEENQKGMEQSMPFWRLEFWFSILLG